MAFSMPQLSTRACCLANWVTSSIDIYLTMILLNDLDIETQNLNPNDELNLQAITLFAS